MNTALPLTIRQAANEAVAARLAAESYALARSKQTTAPDSARPAALAGKDRAL